MVESALKVDVQICSVTEYYDTAEDSTARGNKHQVCIDHASRPMFQTDKSAGQSIISCKD